MGAPEVSSFLTWLAVERRVAASTQNQALSALVFLYKELLRIELSAIQHVPRARTPLTIPVVLSPQEVRLVLERLSGVPRLVAALLYGAGLRLQECLACASRLSTSMQARCRFAGARPEGSTRATRTS